METYFYICIPNMLTTMLYMVRIFLLKEISSFYLFIFIRVSLLFPIFLAKPQENGISKWKHHHKSFWVFRPYHIKIDTDKTRNKINYCNYIFEMETRANSIYHYNETILRSSGTHFRNEIKFMILPHTSVRYMRWWA